jgi:hypothetical protein
VYCAKKITMKGKQENSAYNHLVAINILHRPHLAVLKIHQSEYTYTLPQKIYGQLNTNGQNYYLKNRKCDEINCLKRFMHTE